MRLKTKLVLAATGVTFAIVVVLSTIFVGELLRQRIEQTTSSNEVQAHEVVLMTRQAVEQGLRQDPPANRSEEALHAAVVDALRSNDALADVMNAIVRYSPTVQDVSVTDAHGVTLVSTDPDALDQQMAYRQELQKVRDGSVRFQTEQVFGVPRVLDLSESLERNGQPFLVVHVGVRSTFLKASYEPWLRAALFFALLAVMVSVLAAALLASAALSPIEQISLRLEELTGSGKETLLPEPADPGGQTDTVVRVTRTIARLGEQMRSAEAGYTALQTNLNQMLDTLRDGVVLLTAEGRAVMVSDAVALFLSRPESEMVGLRTEELFDPRTRLGAAVLGAIAGGRQVGGYNVVLEDGRKVQILVDRIDEGRGAGREMGTMVTLRDTESALQLEQELDVSRRLAAVGRLTAGVGHEVKNPINAMVVHLELLKSKLARGDATGGAQRHVEILAGEMQRLDRVVQTLADFTRPMELDLKECDLRKVMRAVVELTGAEMEENGIRVLTHVPTDEVMVRVDAELMRQALLNVMLNAMQAMREGGVISLNLRHEHHVAVMEIVDHGEGIAEDVLPRIFDLYFTTKPKGSGIGLAMTYRILQMHGGALDVRSSTDPGDAERGTTFTLQLPTMTAAAAMEIRKNTAAIGPRGLAVVAPAVGKEERL